MKRRCSTAVVLVCGLVATAIVGDWSSKSTAAESPAAKPVAGVPVEKDMHEFMEYVFQPSYKRLKLAIATEPADKAGWKTIKAESLVLAEGGNLLLMRSPAEEAESWNQTSVEVRELGGQVYQAARSNDYAAARKHYQAMLLKCNQCHDQFADGEHQLAP